MNPETILITGAGSGIGKSLAERLLLEGNTVIATDVNEGSLETLRQEKEGIITRKLNVTSSDAWESLFEWIGKEHPDLGILLNVAGYLMPGWVSELKASDIDRHLDINVKGVMHGTRCASAYWQQGGKEGHVINIASMAALAPIPGLSLYSASKFAVRAFSIAAAQELMEKNISVTVVCPDAVQTPMLELQKEYDSAALTFSGSRILKVEEVADAIVNRVIPDKPLEIFLPPQRGWLARFADVFPTAAVRIGPYLKKRGLHRQSELKS